MTRFEIGWIKQRVPWWAKIAVKVVLARTPVRYQLWRRVSLFVHGAMDSPDYALRVVMAHLRRLGWDDLSGKVVLELGPGDSLLTALITKALHAQRVYMVDAGPFATSEIERYRRARAFLVESGLHPPDLSSCNTIAEFLRACDAEYMTNGLEALRRVPARSVDFIFSQAVLEHVRREELSATLAEMRRIIKPDGASSHEVDFKDHLGGALNNLRFGEKVWESPLMADSGFYTNRVRSSAMLGLLLDAGFSVEVVSDKRWNRLPTPRRRLASEFRNLPDDDLLVSEFDVVARPV